MSVILSMKTFRQLEEKLGTEAAKEVYELAEAVYEEVNKKSQELINKRQLEITGTETDKATRNDLIALRKEVSSITASAKEETLNNLRSSSRVIQAKIRSVVVLLVFNLVLLLGSSSFFFYMLFHAQ